MNLRKRRKDKREKERRLKWIHNTCWVDLNYWEYLRPIYLSPRRTLPLLQTIRVSISLSHPLFHTHTRLCQERLLQTQLIFQTAKLGFQLFPSVPNTCRNIFLILAIPGLFLILILSFYSRSMWKLFIFQRFKLTTSRNNQVDLGQSYEKNST